MSEAQYDPADLSNGHYPHLRKVAVDDPEFLDILRWLEAKGAPRYGRFFVPKGMGLAGDHLILPTEIHWFGGSEGTLKLDAALLFNFPHVALTELKKNFGFGDPTLLEFYPGLRKPVQIVSVSPIGDPWPEKGENCFRPSAADRLEFGAEYADPTGRYRKEKRYWAFVGYGVWVKQ